MTPTQILDTWSRTSKSTQRKVEKMRRDAKRERQAVKQQIYTALKGTK